MKNLLFALLLLVLAGGCSTLVDANAPAGVSLVCHTIADECPKQTEVVAVVEKFADTVRGFDARQTLIVHFYDDDYVFWEDEDGTKAIGYTESEREIYTRSLAVLIHELMHVHLWRETGDPDVTHAAAPGPWTEQDNETIQTLRQEQGL